MSFLLDRPGVGMMMHQRIVAAGVPGDRRRRRAEAKASGWYILRTSPGQTLRLAESLTDAGIEAWTPKRTFKRPKPGRCNLIDGKKPTVEIDAPILPTFVFVRAPSIDAAVVIERDPASQHPAFSILRGRNGEAPAVGEREVDGLQAEERAAAALLTQLRTIEDREERRRIKAAAAATERARHRALLAEPRHFADDTPVTVGDAAAFAGMTGLVKGGDGRIAHVSFGGGLVWKIEAWRLIGDQVQGA